MKILRIPLPILVIAGLIFYMECSASFEQKDQGCDYLGCGSSGIALGNASFAVFINPADIATSQKDNLSLFYRNFYGIKEINQISLANHFLLFKLPLGLGISAFGNKLYRETELRAAVAFKLINKIKMGVSLNLYHLNIKNYGTDLSWGFDIAFMKDITKNITTAFVVSNLNEPGIGTAKENIPARYAFGFAYRPLKIAALCFDIIKDDDFDFDYRFGIRYDLGDRFSFSCGFRDLVNSYSAGLKISNDNYNLNYAFQYHPDLGGSNSLSLGYAF